MLKKCMLPVLLVVFALLILSAAAEPVILPEGEYVVGISIPDGTYTISLPEGAVITISEKPVDILAFAEPVRMSEFDILNAEFGKIAEELTGYNDAISLCDEFDELLALLTKENNGLDSSTEIDMKVRYYKVKSLLRAVPGGIVTAEDGELEEFQLQVDTLRRVMTVLRDEARATMLSNLSQQSKHYAQALEDEQEAKEKLQNALNRQSELVQLILKMDKGVP